MMASTNNNENIPSWVSSGEGGKFCCLLCKCVTDKRPIVEDDEVEAEETKAFLRFLSTSASDLVGLCDKSDVLVGEEDEDEKSLKLLTNWRCEDCVRTINLFSKMGDALQILVTQTKYRFEYSIKTDVPNNVKQILNGLINKCKKTLSKPWLIPRKFDTSNDQLENTIENSEDAAAPPEPEEENQYTEMETRETPESPVWKDIDQSSTSSSEVEEEAQTESMKEGESDEDEDNPSSLEQEQTDKKELKKDKYDFKCNKCKEGFTCPRVFRRHKKLHDEDDALLSSSYRQCQYCFLHLKEDEDAIRNHLVEKHPLEFFEKKFPKGTKINRLNTVIRQLENRGERTNKHECSICKDDLEGMYQTRRHFLQKHLGAVLKRLQLLPKKNTMTGWKSLKNRLNRGVTMKPVVTATPTRRGRGRPKKVRQESTDLSKKTIKKPGRLFCEYCGLIFKYLKSLTYHRVINHAQRLFPNLPPGTCKKKLLAIANKFIVPVSYNVNGNKIKERYRCSKCSIESCAKARIRCHVIVNHLNQVLSGLTENSKPKRVSFSEKAPGVFPFDVEDEDDADKLVEMEDEQEDNLDNFSTKKSDSEEIGDVSYPSDKSIQEDVVMPVELEVVNDEEEITGNRPPSPAPSIEEINYNRSPSPAPSIEVIEIVENRKTPSDPLPRETSAPGTSNSFQNLSNPVIKKDESDDELEIIHDTHTSQKRTWFHYHQQQQLQPPPPAGRRNPYIGLFHQVRDIPRWSRIQF